jgi:prevent-host-death family protein
MRFITVRDLRGKSAQVWQQLDREKEMVITSNGKPVAVLCSVTEETLEESMAAIRRSRAVAAVAALQMTSLELGTDTMNDDDIVAEVSHERKERAR